MITKRRALPIAAALTFVLASCGGSSDNGDADDTEPSATVAATTSEVAEDFTEAEGTETEATEAEDTQPAASATDAPAATDAEEPVPTEAAPTATDAPAASTDPAEPTVGEAAGAGVDVSLVEWEVQAPAEYTAGEITFNATNNGSFPHEFVVIEGEGYESLPRTDSGAVIEDDLPTGALIGRTGRIGGGSSEELVVTLAPGNYVLLCNLGSGDNSHAGQGQRLDVTVS